MNKWAYFTTGGMAGVIFVLAFLLLSQQRDNFAYALPTTQDGTGTDGVVLAPGGTDQQRQDLVWVFFRRPGGHSGAGTTDSKAGGNGRLTLAAYKITQGSKGKMELVAVRDISYDVEMVQYQSEPSVREIKKALEEESKKKEKE